LDTWSFLKAFQHRIKKRKEGKEKKGSSKEEDVRAAIVGLFAGIDLHV